MVATMLLSIGVFANGDMHMYADWDITPLNQQYPEWTAPRWHNINHFSAPGGGTSLDFRYKPGGLFTRPRGETSIDGPPSYITSAYVRAHIWNLNNGRDSEPQSLSSNMPGHHKNVRATISGRYVTNPGYSFHAWVRFR